MPFEPTWSREHLDYLEKAYKEDIPAQEMEKILGRSPASICEMANRLGLTDPDRARRIRYKTGYAKINDDVLAIIEELVVDWGYSARKIVKVLESEYGKKVSKTAVTTAIQTRISPEARKTYRRLYNKYHHKVKK